MWFRRKQREEDLDRELRAHLDLEAGELRDRGLTPDHARYAAQRAFGNTTLVREDTRSAWGLAWLDGLRQDLVYALRAMRHNRAFTAAAILSLALGIGANTAIFSLIDALMLRSLPVHDPGGLVQLRLVEHGIPGNSFGYPTIGALTERKDLFANLGGFSGATLNIDDRRVTGAWVSAGYYATLGLAPAAGRLLGPDDDRPGAAPAAVLSYAYWESRYQRDPEVVGRAITVEGKPVTIVGVSPKGFDGANIGEAANVTLALGALPQLMPERAPQLESGSQWLRVLARPAAGLSLAQLKARLEVVWPQMTPVATTPRMNPERRKAVLSSTVYPAPGGTGWSYLREQFRRPLRILMWLTGLVLLIACANFANLLLARGTARAKEIALRLALGAGRGRLVRQLLTESVLLAVLGAALGLLLAPAAGRVLVDIMAGSRRDGIAIDLTPDVGVLAFTSAIALATGILFGLAPALRATALRPAARAGSRWLKSVVVCQIALSLVLLIGAGLFVRTFENLEHLDTGFRSEGVLLVNVDARRAGYRAAPLAALYQDLLDRFGRMPGVVSASVSNNTPLSGSIYSEPVSINGQPLTKESAHFNFVAPEYFRTLGIRLVVGRNFDERDRPGAPGAAIVNQAFVRAHFPDGRALGQRIAVQDPRLPEFETVGVVSDAVSFSLREPAPPAVFLPYFQHPRNIAFASFELRVSGSFAQTASLVREELRRRLPALAVQSQIQGLDEQVQRAMVQERMLAALGSGFGVLALALSAVGLYGLLAYAVARSTREIGIRMALGARREEVLAQVFGSALRLVAIGVVLGIPASWACARLIVSMLFGLNTTDPGTAIVAAALLAATALAAALGPALRASRIDPMAALRYE